MCRKISLCLLLILSLSVFYNCSLVNMIKPSSETEMVYVDGGQFKIGDVWKDGHSREKPVHRVTLDDYYISKYEVTIKDFLKFLNSIEVSPDGNYNGFQLLDIGQRTSIIYNGTEFKFKKGPFVSSSKCPVMNVTWYGAVKYCNWLSKKKGLEPVYVFSKKEIRWKEHATGYRLPTEAEWEYAARSKGRNDRKYSGCNEYGQLHEYAWGSIKYRDKVYPVGTKKPNDIGLYDMTGNVYEWCWDWYHPYTSGPKKNPKGPENGKEKVVRGGYWFHFPDYCRNSGRSKYKPDFTHCNIGFRIARSY